VANLGMSKPCVLCGSIVWKGIKREGLEAKATGARKQGQQAVNLLDLYVRFGRGLGACAQCEGVSAPATSQSENLETQSH